MMRLIKIAAIFALSIPMLISIAVPVMLGVSSSAAGGNGAAIVEVAKSEYDDYVAADIHGGDKYRAWINGGAADGAPWCATFVSWCANECGFIESGIVPKNGAVLGFLDYYRSHPDMGAVFDGNAYSRVPGDFIVWQRSLDPDSIIESHIGIVERVGDEGRVYTIEASPRTPTRALAWPATTSILPTRPQPLAQAMSMTRHAATSPSTTAEGPTATPTWVGRPSPPRAPTSTSCAKRLA